MRVLGVDPGLTRCGVGVVEGQPARPPRLVSVDVLRTDPDLRDYNVNFDKIERVLDWKPSRTIDDGIAEVLAALRNGTVDPDDRRSYTLKQYRFLVDVERAFREMSIDGHVLS